MAIAYRNNRSPVIFFGFFIFSLDFYPAFLVRKALLETRSDRRESPDFFW